MTDRVRTIVVEDEPASRRHIVDLATTVPSIAIVGEFGDGALALEAIATERPDLVFLDVQLPELDGFEIIDALGPNTPPAIVFITAFDHYAIRAFDARAVDYVLKPFSAARFLRAANRAVEQLGQRASATGAEPENAAVAAANQVLAARPLRQFAVRQGTKFTLIPVASVDWIDVADNYLRLHSGRRSYLVRGSIAGILPRLDADMFLRVNRGLIVNVRSISVIEPVRAGVYQLQLTDGSRLQTSRPYLRSIRGLLR